MNESIPIPTSLELWTRSFSPATFGPNQERAHTLLERIESTQPDISTSVHVWGKCLERAEYTPIAPQVRTIERRLEAFDEWAERTGRTLEPCFRTRSVESTITGHTYEVRRLPTIALAEFRKGELTHVAPSYETADGEGIDVLDRLESLLETETPTDATVDAAGTADSNTSIATAVTYDDDRSASPRHKATVPSAGTPRALRPATRSLERKRGPTSE